MHDSVCIIHESIVLLSLADLTRAFSPGRLALPENSGASMNDRYDQYSAPQFGPMVDMEEKRVKMSRNVQNLRACQIENNFCPMATNFGYVVLVQIVQSTE